MAYETLGDASAFHRRSQQALDGWKYLGGEFKAHPFRTTGELVAPGVMQAMRRPGNPGAWGAATVDVGLFALAAGKVGQGARVNKKTLIFRNIDSINTRTPKNLSSGAESSASTIQLRNQLIGKEISGGHAFVKHVLQQGEFKELGIQSRAQFARHIEAIVNNPTATRHLSSSRVAYWHEATKTVVIRNPRAIDGGTAFQPNNGRAYFDNLR